MCGFPSSPMQASYIRSRISYACVMLRAAKEACLKTVWGPWMETASVGTVFDGEPNPKFHSLMQGSLGSQVFGKNTFPQHLRSGGHSEALGRGAGSRAGARRGGRQSPGAGREEGRPTWTTEGPANQRCPRWARPLPARAPTGWAPHC